MSTKFKEPLNNTWHVEEGFIFPNYADPKFAEDKFQGVKNLERLLAPINSFEFQQGAFGQYSHFYSQKLKNSILNACFRTCVTKDNLKTRNMNQQDKLCARECLLTGASMMGSSNIFILRQGINKLTTDPTEMKIPIGQMEV